MRYSLLPLLILLSSTALGVCNLEDSHVQDVIDRLKVEVVCNSGESLTSCEKLINSFATNSTQGLEEDPEPFCSPTTSLSAAAVASSERIIKVLAQTETTDRLVNSVEEFYEHTQKHRARVKALGLELFKSQPTLFEGLNQWQVEQALAAHDQAKVRASSLAPDGRPFYQVLYKEGYGKKMDLTIVNALNANDKAIMSVTQEKIGIGNNPDLQAKITRIEKIADLVDRGLSPVSTEEFGRPMEKASSFLSDIEDRKLAEFLEHKYQTVTKDLQYKKLPAIRGRAVATRLYLQERFSAALSRLGSRSLSSRSLAASELGGGRKLATKIGKKISNHGLSSVLKVVNGSLLYFSEIASTGCSENGYHDWVQDPNCRPDIGLTPKVIEFLNEEWETQKFFLKNDQHTCEVLLKNYEESIQAPNVTQCQPQKVDFKTARGDKIKVQFNSNHSVTSVLFEKNSLLNKIYPQGAPRSVKLKDDGTIEQVCTKKDCFSGNSKAAEDPAAFVQSLSYQIQKAIHCCQPTNSSFQVRCQ